MIHTGIEGLAGLQMVSVLLFIRIEAANMKYGLSTSMAQVSGKLPAHQTLLFSIRYGLLTGLISRTGCEAVPLLSWTWKSLGINSPRNLYRHFRATMTCDLRHGHGLRTGASWPDGNSPLKTLTPA